MYSLLLWWCAIDRCEEGPRGYRCYLERLRSRTGVLGLEVCDFFVTTAEVSGAHAIKLLSPRLKILQPLQRRYDGGKGLAAVNSLATKRSCWHVIQYGECAGASEWKMVVYTFEMVMHSNMQQLDFRAFSYSPVTRPTARLKPLGRNQKKVVLFIYPAAPLIVYRISKATFLSVILFPGLPSAPYHHFYMSNPRAPIHPLMLGIIVLLSR